LVGDNYWIILDLMDSLENVKTGEINNPEIIINIPEIQY